MTDQHGDTTASGHPLSPDPQMLAQNMVEVARRCRRLVSEFVERPDFVQKNLSSEPTHIGAAFLEMTAHLIANPSHLIESQVTLWGDYFDLFHSTAKRLMGEEVEPVIAPAVSDKRFKHADWNDNQFFDFIKQSYLLTARWMQNTVKDVDDIDIKTKQKVAFYTRQFVDAMAPTNFVLTNPEVLRATLSSNGENLIKGLDHILEDLEDGDGRLAIKMTDTTAFEVGRDLATTPGKVVYRSPLMELIQYAPATEQVYERPLLIIPPWINKFYILDLKPESSFIKWTIEQGHTVFVISWVNPDGSLAEKGFDSYMTEGILDALDQIARATGETDVNAIGYCIGGTLLSATLAYMAAKGDDRIKSATLFTTQVDFSEAGDLSVFIDESQIDHLTERMGEKGYLEGRDMATTFNMLRANDLIWSFVINNYLLGKEPFPFDLLYWNDDSTRMPITVHSFYLREFYQHNRMSTAGGITLAGVPIDLGKVKVPIYELSTKEDHIAPARSVFKGAKFFSGPVRFVLAGSGHVAGVVNPPVKEKYQYWINEGETACFDQWCAGATEHKGSWWPDWSAWLAKQSAAKVPARTPGGGQIALLCDAPGTYVKVKA